MSNSIFKKYTSSDTFQKIEEISKLDTVSAMWQYAVENYSDRIAIVDRGDYTYSSLDSMVNSYRAVLLDSGIKKGDCVGIYMTNGIDFVKAFLAVTTFGCQAVLLPPHLDNMTVFGCSMKFALKAIIFGEELKGNLDITEAKNPSVKLLSAELTSDTVAPAVKCDGSDLCTVIFTGGTTGKSKGAKLCHRAVMAGVVNGCYGYEEVFFQRYFHALPLTHVFGLIRNLLTSLATGSCLFICRNNKDMFRDIAVFKPTIIVLVPALAEMALNLSKQFGRNMFGNDLKTIICGAATVAPYLVLEYNKMGINLLPGYGLTESANLVSGNPEAMRKPDSVGLIYPGMDYKIIDGELWLKGVNMMDGYVGDEENSIAYSPDGYFKTGDLVRIDDEGFLYITGRIKEIIVLSTGENVSPAELESKFYAIDVIQDCMVYSDMQNGREILAIEIVPRMTTIKSKNIENAEQYIKEAVDVVNKTLPSFQKISKVVIRQTDFVRSASMKIVRNKNGNKN